MKDGMYSLRSLAAAEMSGFFGCDGGMMGYVGCAGAGELRVSCRGGRADDGEVWRTSAMHTVSRAAEAAAAHGTSRHSRRAPC
jgi:hypothetical protein